MELNKTKRGNVSPLYYFFINFVDVNTNKKLVRNNFIKNILN